MTQEVTRETAASPASLWKLWSDASSWPIWNPDAISLKLEGPFASGTTGVFDTKGGHHHHITLQDVSAEKGFSLLTAVRGMKLTFRCEIRPVNGKIQISQAVSVGGLLGAIMGGPASKSIAKTFPPILEGLATHAEKLG